MAGSPHPGIAGEDEEPVELARWGVGGWGSPGCCPPEELEIIPAVAQQPLLVPLQPQRPQPLAHAGHSSRPTAGLAQRLHQHPRGQPGSTPQGGTPQAGPTLGWEVPQWEGQDETPKMGILGWDPPGGDPSG